MPVETLQLPRPLVNQLLHQAQQAAGFCQGFVWQDSHGRFRCAPLPANADLPQFTKQARRQDERLFAYYHAAQQTTSLPSVKELETVAKHVKIYLGVALDIKGVLQLRGWRIDASRAVELDLTISETGS